MATKKQVKKAEELDNSKLFDVHKWSDYPEVNDVVNYLHPKIKKSCRGDEIRKKHVKVIILDLWATWLIDPKMYIAYDRSPNNYLKVGSRYNKCHISKKTIDVVDALTKLGFVSSKHTKGYFDPIKKSGKLSRMRARKKLIDRILKSSCTPEMIETKPDKECIILRDSNKKPERYGKGEIIKEPRRIKLMRDDLYDYNNLIRCTHIDIPFFPPEGVPTKSKDPKKKKPRNIKINHADKFIRRIFNNKSWNDGGRYYGGWWQGVPNNDYSGMWREKLRIDGQPTIELDYSALHIVLCYGLVGVDYWKEIGTDPYNIPEYNHIDGIRDFLKEVLLTILNCKDEKQACQVIGSLLRNAPDNEHFWVKKALGWKDLKHEKIIILINNLKKHHPKIKKFFHTGQGVKLQNADSRVAEIIIREFVMVDQPILCLHDGFIVKRKDFNDLLYQMKNAYKIVINENKGKSKKVLINPPEIKYDESKPIIFWLGVGNPFKNRLLNKKIFDETMKEPLKDKNYKIRWIRFNQLKSRRDKKYYAQ